MANPTFDALLGEVLLHNHSEKLNTSGGTLTGDLDILSNVIILQASDGSRWRLNINTSGVLVTEQIITGAGTPFGLLLTITNSS